MAQSRCRQNSCPSLSLPAWGRQTRLSVCSCFLSPIFSLFSQRTPYILNLIFLPFSLSSSPAACIPFLRCCAPVSPLFRSFPPFPFPYIAASYYATIWKREGSRPQVPRIVICIFFLGSSFPLLITHTGQLSCLPHQRHSRTSKDSNISDRALFVIWSTAAPSASSDTSLTPRFVLHGHTSLIGCPSSPFRAESSA